MRTELTIPKALVAMIAAYSPRSWGARRKMTRINSRRPKRMITDRVMTMTAHRERPVP